MVIVVSQEAIKAVPRLYTEGSLALGATRWQTVFRQVLPSAMPGIITGIILSVSRALGETAPLITIGAVAVIRQVPDQLDDKFTVLPIQIFDWSSRPQVGYHEAAAAAIIVLVGMLLVLNSAAIVIRARAQKKV
jgi:phosphate transport system permease protein